KALTGGKGWLQRHMVTKLQDGRRFLTQGNEENEEDFTADNAENADDGKPDDVNAHLSVCSVISCSTFTSQPCNSCNFVTRASLPKARPGNSFTLRHS